MKRQALRGFGSDAGQMFELVDQALDGFGEIRHAQSLLFSPRSAESSSRYSQ